jgi:hypothetical protein
MTDRMYIRVEEKLHACTRDCHHYIPRGPPYLMKKLKKSRVDPPELGVLQDVCSLEGKRARGG